MHTTEKSIFQCLCTCVFFPQVRSPSGQVTLMFVKSAFYSVISYSDGQPDRTYNHWCCWHRLIFPAVCSSVLIGPHIHYVFCGTFLQGNYTTLESRFLIKEPTKGKTKSESFRCSDNFWSVRKEEQLQQGSKGSVWKQALELLDIQLVRFSV